MVVTENSLMISGDAKMKNLLTVTAAIELGAGLVLMVIPSFTLKLLLSSPLDSPAALTVARVAAVALLALGVGCWLMRRDSESRAAKGLISAMLVYNAGVSAVLAYPTVGLGLPGIGIWPFVLVHVVMIVWCFKAICSRTADK